MIDIVFLLIGIPVPSLTGYCALFHARKALVHPRRHLCPMKRKPVEDGTHGLRGLKTRVRVFIYINMFKPAAPIGWFLDGKYIFRVVYKPPELGGT